MQTNLFYYAEHKKVNNFTLLGQYCMRNVIQ